jgi:tetratricopeptide (TPR) repeat protein
MLLACILFPVLFMDKAFVFEFMRSIWPLGLVFIALPIGLNVFYLVNRRLFTLLGREDWPALVAYLEKKTCQDGHYKSRYVQLYAQSCLALENFDKAVEFSQKVLAVKPVLVEANALVFGAAYILGGNKALAVDFYRERLKKAGPKGEKSEWIRWYYGFSLAMIGDAEQAAATFGNLATSARGIPVTGLSAFFLSEKLKYNLQMGKDAENGRDRVRKAIKTIDRRNKKTAKLKTKVHGAIIKKYLDETGQWIFKEGQV